jgi:hypothetical protein
MRDHMMGWPQALDHIDAPKEYVPQKRRNIAWLRLATPEELALLTK